MVNLEGLDLRVLKIKKEIKPEGLKERQLYISN
jgi:hypothetical protein